LEEHSIESLPDRCESCGRQLTDAERKAALEAETSPVLCSTCAAEQEPLEDAEDDQGL
jgi:hypothetical protein